MQTSPATPFLLMSGSADALAPVRAAESGPQADAVPQLDQLLDELAVSLDRERSKYETLRRLLTATNLRLGRVRRELSEARLRADHDALTGLPNRRALDSDGQACGSGLMAMLYVDLNDFKPVNDRNGHAVGDALLCLMANRLRLAIRQADKVYRVGGDEFVCVLNNVPDNDLAVDIARDVLHSLVSPCEVAGTPLRLDASIGVAVQRHPGEAWSALAARADQAMYLAKVAGGGIAAAD